MLLGGRKNKKKRERGGRMTVNDKEREGGAVQMDPR
jgi:hypothetical protein